MNGFRLALSLLGCGCLAACQLVAGIEDLSVTDGGEVGPTADGSLDSSSGDSPGSDSSSSGSSSGDSPGPDSPGNEPGDATDTGTVSTSDASDGGAPSDAQSVAFCASFTTSPTFCDDFDEFTPSLASGVHDRR